MGPRPSPLDLTNGDLSDPPPLPPKQPWQMDLPSPRTGEVPPALSPLDAFAMQSRLLAKKFEQEAENGRRISRLPHNDVAQQLASRPGYFRDMSSGSEGGMSDVQEVREESSPTSPPKTQFLVSKANEHNRPKSHYPMFGNAGRAESTRNLATPFYDAVEELPEPEPENQDYFGVAVPRATSPEPVDQRTVNVQVATPVNMPSLTSSVDSLQSTQPRTLTDGSTKSKRSLAPPKSPAHPKSPRSIQSIRSVPPDSGDEESSATGSHAVSSSRKFSGSSGMSRPQSPLSPFMPPSMHRSPSTTSEFSTTGSQRRNFNFSRPLSSSSLKRQPDPRPSFDSRSSFETRPSTDIPYRQRSVTSQSTHPSSGTPSRQPSQDDAIPMAGGTPRPSDAGIDDVFDDRPTTSYTYRKFTLPRGRNVERTSRGTRDSWIQRQFTWDNEASAEPDLSQQLEMPSGKPSLETEQPQQLEKPDDNLALGPEVPRKSENTTREFPPLEPPPPVERSRSRPQSPAWSERLSRDRTRRNRATSSATRSQSAEPRTVQKAAALHKSTPSVRTHGTDSTDRTIRAVPLHQRVPSVELTAEEHLEIGIQNHTSGELSKSTYHLRIAAREGSSTGMLLYALACRHGWGMRPNQEEGVRWLKKAIDGAGLEVADVEQTLAAATSKNNVDPVAAALERRTRKAQFALAVYELGISYMNGWGCPKDKPLAVQCYEVAGSWGDCDALAEAGFCYTQGIGCKKDFKKAATLYRKAADGGMSMAGNSWIYKEKYMDNKDEDDEKKSTKGSQKESKKGVDASLSSTSKDGKPAGRSRARSIWGRSKK